MKLKKYLQALVMLALFLAALSAYAGWYSVVGKESADAADLAQQIGQRSQTSVRTEEAKNELERALSDEAAITGYFVDTADVVPFLESLQETGKSLGTTVDVVSVSAQPAKPHSVLQLSLHIAGPFDGVERTLGAIEYQPYDTSVSSVTLDTTGSDDGAAGAWTAAVTVNVGIASTTATSTASSTHP